MLLRFDSLLLINLFHENMDHGYSASVSVNELEEDRLEERSVKQHNKKRFAD